MSATRVLPHDADLAAALRDAPSGAPVTFGPGTYRLSGTVRRAAPLTLAGQGASATELVLEGEASLLLESTGGEIRGIMLRAASAQRQAPALQAEHCRDLVLRDLVLRDMREGVALRDCTDVRLDGISFRRIGLAASRLHGCMQIMLRADVEATGLVHRHAAILLEDCTRFSIRASLRRVSGSGIELRSAAIGCHSGEIALHASACFRALTVLGTASVPCADLDVTAAGEEFGDVAVLLSNVSRATVDATALAWHGEPLLRLAGGGGARDCTLHLGRVPPEAVVQAGGSTGNRIVSEPPQEAAA
ncbi:MAG TPA: hypothetical protein VME92_16110 [Acetobacteraceae bacterium]|nr:hypothetical protein [Acetobacteraceae bacterium]